MPLPLILWLWWAVFTFGPLPPHLPEVSPVKKEKNRE